MTRTLSVILLLILVTASSLSAQTTATEPEPRSCTIISKIGVAVHDSFTARQIYSRETNGEPDTLPTIELVARDSRGRIRVQLQSISPAEMARLNIPQSETDPGKDPNTLVEIFDCLGGRNAIMQPAKEISRTRPLLGPVRESLTLQHPYSFYAALPPRDAVRDKPQVENLGTKEIEGVVARGIRTTTMGADEDKWKGKPVSVEETWVSDELAVTLISTINNLKLGVSFTMKLADIKRTEPDHAQFVIPAHYKVDTVPMPVQCIFQSSSGGVGVTTCNAEAP
jgi:hypothetical protein